jgi:hypothetical protein
MKKSFDTNISDDRFSIKTELGDLKEKNTSRKAALSKIAKKIFQKNQKTKIN